MARTVNQIIANTLKVWLSTKIVGIREDQISRSSTQNASNYKLKIITVVATPKRQKKSQNWF